MYSLLFLLLFMENAEIKNLKLKKKKYRGDRILEDDAGNRIIIFMSGP